MRARLLIAPPWVQGAVAGLIGGLISGSLLVLQFRYADKNTWPYALIWGAIFLILCGVTIGVSIARLASRTRGTSEFQTLRGLPPAARSVALRAASRGSIPNDPVARKAALHIASSTLECRPKPRPRDAVVFAVVTLAGIGAAVFIAPWYWIFVVFILWVSGLELLQPRRLRRRVARLAADPPTTDAVAGRQASS